MLATYVKFLSANFIFIFIFCIYRKELLIFIGVKKYLVSQIERRFKFKSRQIYSHPRKSIHILHYKSIYPGVQAYPQKK